MSTNRIQRFSAVGLTVTVSLVLLLAVQVGLTSAATDTSSSMALQGEVNIHLWGPPLGPPDANEGHGRFTMIGAISDRGSFVNESQGLDNGKIGRGVRTLFGYKGTIRIIVGHFGGWRVTKGTGAYAGLRGRGSGGRLWRGNQGPVDTWMEGTVSK